MKNDITRGFSTSEFEQRTQKMHELMHTRKLDAVFLTTEANIRYFTGFHTQFWQSPTRPWFVIIPLNDKPIAVIPEIGQSGMAETWIDNIVTWPSPQPDDDGISALLSVFSSLPYRFGNIGANLGLQSYLRMPQSSFNALTEGLSGKDFVDVAEDLHHLRAIKSPAEIEKIRRACDITSTGFSLIPTYAHSGNTEREICRHMHTDLMSAGADGTPYLIAGSGHGGYDSIIMGPTDRVIAEGDILVIDTGTVYDGYFSDFDRNFAFGYADDRVKRVHRCIYDATEAGFAAAKPGATTSQLYHAMWHVMEAGGALGCDVGRLGHGLGSELTEWPSNTATDDTPLEEGMVITLEPGMMYAEGKSMVHEENILITAEGAEWLSHRVDPDITIIH